MAVTILVTGFGPFPGAPFNPTGPLVERLARLRRPGLANAKIVAHIFPTSYAAVDRDLPKLIAKHKPDALLMFGLAPRAKTHPHRDAGAQYAVAVARRRRRRASPPRDRAGRPGGVALPAPARAPARGGARRARAGRAVARCRALSVQLPVLARGRGGGQKGRPARRRFRPCAAGPAQRRSARGARQKRRLALADLARAGSLMLTAIAAAARR